MNGFHFGISHMEIQLESAHCNLVPKIRQDIGVRNVIRIICKKDLPSKTILVLKNQK